MKNTNQPGLALQRLQVLSKLTHLTDWPFTTLTRHPFANEIEFHLSARMPSYCADAEHNRRCSPFAQEGWKETEAPGRSCIVLTCAHTAPFTLLLLRAALASSEKFQGLQSVEGLELSTPARRTINRAGTVVSGTDRAVFGAGSRLRPRPSMSQRFGMRFLHVQSGQLPANATGTGSDTVFQASAASFFLADTWANRLSMKPASHREQRLG